jgi:hypothetical protein
MADLLSMQHKTGSVQLLGFHERGDGGGGVFFWDAAQDKAEHNGGTVIDPDVTYPTDWDNQTQLAAWFAGDNTGTGVWRRQYDGAVNVKWFGAKGDGVTDDVLSINRTILGVNSTGINVSNKSVPTDATEIKNALINANDKIIFPKGRYTIYDKIEYSYYSKFIGEEAIIEQKDSTKPVFYSERVYQNLWQDLIIIGGTTQIHAQNGIIGGNGLEGAMTLIKNCKFTAAQEFCIKAFKPSGQGGGQHVVIETSWFINFAQAIYNYTDMIILRDSWLETNVETMQPSNSAWIEANGYEIIGCDFVPAGNHGGGDGDKRYIDALGFGGKVVNTRFGAEDAGIPTIYSYCDANSTSTYPYWDGGSIIVENCTGLATGNSTHGVITLKTGIPKVIKITGTVVGADGKWISTDYMENTTFDSYMSSFSPSSNKRLSIHIYANQKWGVSLTSSTAHDELLRPYTTYEKTEDTGTKLLTNIVDVFNGIKFNNLPSSDIKTLDWYEEGTFTPTVYGATSAGVTTYVLRQSRFQRVGRVVNFQLTVIWSNATGTGELRVGGLPYLSDSTSGNFSSFSIHASGLTLPSGYSQITARVSKNVDYIRILAVGSGRAQSSIGITGNSNTAVTITGHYFTS